VCVFWLGLTVLLQRGKKQEKAAGEGTMAALKGVEREGKSLLSLGDLGWVGNVTEPRSQRVRSKRNCGKSDYRWCRCIE